MDGHRYKLISVWVGVLGLALLFGFWRFQCIIPFGWQQDEGAHITTALALSEGYQLYSEAQVLLYPLLLELLGLVFRVFEPSLQLARIVGILFGMTYLIVSGVTGRYLSSWVGAIATTAALLLDQLLFKGAGLALSDVPPLVFCSVSVLLMLMYLRSRSRVKLCVGALACSLSMLSKPVIPFFPIWIAIVVLAANWWKDDRLPRFSLSRFVVDGCLALIFFGLPIALCFVFYDAQAFFDTAFLAEMRLREVEGWCPECNLGIIWYYLRNYWGILVLALAEPLLDMTGDRYRLRYRVLLWLLFIVSLLGLWMHSPLFERHCIVLGLPLSLLAGLSVTSLVHLFRSKGQTWRLLVGAVVIALVLFFAVHKVRSMIVWCGFQAKHDQGGPEAACIRFLDQISAPSEVIASDDLLLAFLAHRRVPPQLSDVSHARNLSSHLTESTAIAAVKEYDVQTLLRWTRRFEDLQGFVQWTDKRFVSSSDFGEGRRVLHGRRYQNEEEIPNLQSVPNTVLGDSIVLVGYRLGFETVRAGDQLPIVLYWKGLDHIEQDYQVLVHLVEPGAGVPLSQADGAPVNGLYPATVWQPGEIVADVHNLKVDSAVPAGEYNVLVGMYELESTTRLPVVVGGRDAGRDVVRLTTITVVSPE